MLGAYRGRQIWCPALFAFRFSSRDIRVIKRPLSAFSRGPSSESVHAHPMFNEIGPGIWETDFPHRVFGLVFGRRLVLVRLPNGGLWAHSSLAPTTRLRANIATLGEIRHIVGPNMVHDAYLNEFSRAYPLAQFHTAPGLPSANEELRPGLPLTDQPHPDWAPIMDQHLVQGMPRLNEVEFFHRPSRTLILTDLAFNIGPPRPLGTQLFFRLYGAWKKFGPTPAARALIKEKADFQRSLRQILTWDFDRIIPAHGAVIERDGKKQFQAAFAKYL